MSILGELVVQWCITNDKNIPKIYLAMLEEACEKAQPSFISFAYGERFREITSNRQHFAIQQINSAVEEASGAERLLKLIGELPENDLDLECKFLKHAKEEIFHHGLFLELFDKVFPDIAIDRNLEVQVKKCIPDVKNISKINHKVSQHRILEEVIQINVGEMRNLIQLKLSLPVVIAHCADSDSEKRCHEIMERLIHDEGGHIYYTAVLIEKLVCKGGHKTLSSLMDEAFYLFDLEAKRFMWPEIYLADSPNKSMQQTDEASAD